MKYIPPFNHLMLSAEFHIYLTISINIIFCKQCIIFYKYK